MKRVVITSLMTIVCLAGLAQNTDEWLHQKKTQIKYLLNQIAASQVYIEVLQKGYSIAHEGLNTINDIKHGDFTLHHGFFDGLKRVNPKIKNWGRVADIIALQVQIIKETHKRMDEVRNSAKLSASELQYCDMVIHQLLDDCAESIDELYQVLLDGHWQMKDDERISRIDRLYKDMQDKYSFSAAFSNEVGSLVINREAEQMEIDRSRAMRAN
ncbi:MAG: hypothetical protein ABI480_19045 [Chitinophagaceae bacterium]